MRATLRFSSPAPLALPRMTSSMRVRIDAGAGHSLADHQCGQVIGADRGECPAVAAHRGAGTAYEKSLWLLLRAMGTSFTRETSLSSNLSSNELSSAGLPANRRAPIYRPFVL